ncbi:MAG: HesA/MoeB/ThiF family protein [Desulfobacterales bacterium]|jgi:adenylyltransferase/sulfurtransferase|nr:HesA/MoeB/ThiF family protein [Desulfobacterales bacterium]
MDPLNAENRFQRQTLLPEVGRKGQKKLQQAGVFILGSGGLASSAAYYLVAAGIGRIGIADDDRVDISNLNRQILHNTSCIGMLKVDSARKTLEELNPAVNIHTYPRRFTSPGELIAVLTPYDIVVDCTDNYATRFHLNDACIQTGKPWIYGAVSGFEGQVMTIMPGKGPCYRCLYPSVPAEADSVVPVIGVTPGMIGIIEATEAIKHILGIGTPLIGRMLVIDLLEMNMSEFNINRNQSCSACGE